MRLQRFDKFINMLLYGSVGKNELLIGIANHGSARLVGKKQCAGANERLIITQLIKIIRKVLLYLRQKLPFSPRPFQIGLNQRIRAHT